MVDSATQISPADFQYICDLTRRLAAIEMDSGKEYLVQSRLSPIAADAGCRDLSEFVRRVRMEETGPLAGKVIDALTTNETLFFRDCHPFEALRKVIIPELMERRKQERRLSIWSAAASTGQEAYSFSIMLKENFPELVNWKVELVGTDISPTALAQAREGRYSKIEMNRGLAAPLLIRYFQQQDNRWVLRDDIRKMVEFREMNLAGSWHGLPVFDLVFIRNVMIYMSLDTRRKILRNLRGHIAPDGYLLLGSSENLLQTDEGFDPVEVNNSLFYKLRP
jgi:chemotaxis protein methyltransferase CheR